MAHRRRFSSAAALRSRRALWIVAFAAAVLAAALSTAAQDQRKVTRLAEGVYAIEHAGQGGGNSTVVIGGREVLVVDSCFLPSAAKEDIAQIRQWTDKPVAFVVNTHFHNDHNFGNRAYIEAFPAAEFIAHRETKIEMDRFGPGSEGREKRSRDRAQKMLDSGKGPDGSDLSESDKAAVKDALAQLDATIAEMQGVVFQSATITFDRNLTVDLGGREVEIEYLGKGNTAGDAVVYLPKEKIVAAGDLLAAPIPNLYDGYPVEWIETLNALAQLDAATIVPGHGPVMHDKSYIYLVRDLLQSAVDQMNAKLSQTRPAMMQTLDDVKDSVDLSAFRQRFAGNDKDLGSVFDDATTHLVKLAFLEASLR